MVFSKFKLASYGSSQLPSTRRYGSISFRLSLCVAIALFYRCANSDENQHFEKDSEVKSIGSNHTDQVSDLNLEDMKNTDVYLLETEEVITKDFFKTEDGQPDKKVVLLTAAGVTVAVVGTAYGFRYIKKHGNPLKRIFSESVFGESEGKSIEVIKDLRNVVRKGGNKKLVLAKRPSGSFRFDGLIRNSSELSKSRWLSKKELKQFQSVRIGDKNGYNIYQLFSFNEPFEKVLKKDLFVREEAFAPGGLFKDFDLDSYRLKIQKKLGKGGEGIVYQGKIDGKTVAVKVSEEVKASELITNLYVNYHAKGLTHNVYDFFKTNKNQMTIVMEPLEKAKYKSNKQVLELLKGFSKILDKKVYHNDIKPQNLMMNKKGELRLIDWGFANSDPKFESPSAYFMNNPWEGTKKHLAAMARLMLQIKYDDVVTKDIADLRTVLKKHGIRDKYRWTGWSELKIGTRNFMERYMNRKGITRNQFLSSKSHLSEYAEYIQNAKVSDGDFDFIFKDRKYIGDDFDRVLIDAARGKFDDTSEFLERLKSAINP